MAHLSTNHVEYEDEGKGCETKGDIDEERDDCCHLVVLPVILAVLAGRSVGCVL